MKDGAKMTTKTINQAVEELKNEITNRWENSPKMIKYCVGEISSAVKFENGFILAFNKKTIKKRFCFGVGAYATCTDEEQERASNMVEKSRNDVAYFLEENFKESFGFTDKLIKEESDGWNIYAKITRAGDESKECYLVSEKQILHRDDKKEDFYKLTDSDIENLKNELASEKEKFQKRLNIYLKKFGLSKVNSWSYIVD